VTPVFQTDIFRNDLSEVVKKLGDVLRKM